MRDLAKSAEQAAWWPQGREGGERGPNLHPSGGAGSLAAAVELRASRVGRRKAPEQAVPPRQYNPQLHLQPFTQGPGGPRRGQSHPGLRCAFAFGILKKCQPFRKPQGPVERLAEPTPSGACILVGGSMHPPEQYSTVLHSHLIALSLGPIIFPLWAASVFPSLKFSTSSVVCNFLPEAL